MMVWKISCMNNEIPPMASIVIIMTLVRRYISELEGFVAYFSNLLEFTRKSSIFFPNILKSPERYFWIFINKIFYYVDKGSDTLADI